MQQNVMSADGVTTIRGVTVAKTPSGDCDLRFFCGTCHVFDPATHHSMAGTSTVSCPTDCTACHRHVKADGSPSSSL